MASKSILDRRDAYGWLRLRSLASAAFTETTITQIAH